LATAPLQVDPRDRVISITVAVLSLVLAVHPLVVFGLNLVVGILHHEHGMPSVLILFVAAGLIGISLTIFRGFRRGEVYHWLGGGPLYYVLLVVLAGVFVGETKLIEQLMVGRMGVRPKIADLLMLLPIIAGVLVFAFYWRRASAARVRP
jgi:hypothetical protein